jgi:hypothetical protein
MDVLLAYRLTELGIPTIFYINTRYRTAAILKTRPRPIEVVNVDSLRIVVDIPANRSPPPIAIGVDHHPAAQAATHMEQNIPTLPRIRGALMNDTDGTFHPQPVAIAPKDNTFMEQPMAIIARAVGIT